MRFTHVALRNPKNMAANESAIARGISRQLAYTIRTSQGLSGRIRCSDLLARDAMERFLPVTDGELQNVTREANRKKLRARIKSTLGAFLLRAHPRESDNARAILNDRTARDTKDTRVRTDATSSNATQNDTEQTCPTQATLIRNCCQNGTGCPQRRHELTRRWSKSAIELATRNKISHLETY